jgi:hypothetical protein
MEYNKLSVNFVFENVHEAYVNLVLLTECTKLFRNIKQMNDFFF